MDTASADYRLGIRLIPFRGGHFVYQDSMQSKTSNAATKAANTPTQNAEPELDWVQRSRFDAELQGKNKAASLAKELGSNAEYVLRDALRIAEGELREKARAKSLYDSIEAISELMLESGHKMIGFDESGKLVYCDGKKVQQISLKKSVQLYARLYKEYWEDDASDETYNTYARAKWLKMVAASIK